jgi:hypothetical protein
MMGEGHAELLELIARIRSRWRAVSALRVWMRAAVGAVVALGLALLTHQLVQPAAGALVALWTAAVAVAGAAIVWALASLRRAPGNGQLARFIEERCPELEDSFVTAVAHDGLEPHPMSQAVVHDAVRRARQVDTDRIISRSTVRRAALLAVAASVALVAIGTFSAPPVLQVAKIVRVHLFPETLDLRVTPGDVKVRAGESVRVIATLSADELVTPLLRLGRDGEWRETPMEKTGSGFAFTVDRVEQDFRYTVTAAGASSREYGVTVMRPPHVERIDLGYEFPPALGMPPREEQDGGDIYGPAGTRVRVTVHTDKPVREAALALTGRERIALSNRGGVLQGELTITEDGSYRVALADADGLTNPGDTEYFIRTLQDRPPDVRIIRPASDRQVTPLEEVGIVARAEDDFGVAALDLVYTTAGSPEKAVPFTRTEAGATVTGRRTLYLEDLKVRPGDVVAYYARARDLNRGKRSNEARSDIFFLEVTPFEEEFVASQSQGTGGGGNDQGLEQLIQAQKDIITATWNLDRRGREAGGQSRDDIRTVARGQKDVHDRTASLLAEMQRASDRRRRLPVGRGGAAPPQAADAMAEAVGRAVTAMAGASQQLDALKTSTALPHEMTALNELLRAQAEVRRREIQQQQANGTGGAGSNRQQQDLSSLFDRELAREQETNYETAPGREQDQEQKSGDEALDKVRDLARRQDALNESQRQLAQKRESMTQEEVRRELERLTREQSDLRRQAEELARELQKSSNQQGQSAQNQQGQSAQNQGRQSAQSGQSGQSGQGGQGRDRQQASRELQQASEDMQNAASELRRNNPGQASARGSRAAERLRDVEQQMRGSQPDDRRRALGELQLEARQLADAQRRLGNEANGTGRSGDRADRARQRATEQERLADRTARVEEGVKQLAGGRGGTDERQQNALGEAAKDVDAQRLSERMRSAARAERQASEGAQNGKEPATGREGEAIARGLDRLADRLGAAAGDSEQSQQLSEELSRIRRLREELTSLDRQLSELRDQTGDQTGGRQGSEAGRQNGSQAGRQGGRGVQPGGRGQDLGGDGPWQEARELLNEMRQNAENVPAEADGFNPGRSAPGTEAWKQDFEKWDELKVQLAAALERAERSTLDQLRGQQSRDRLSAGATQSVPESYRRLVEKYYRALASESDERAGGR